MKEFMVELDELDELIYISDLNTYDLLYINRYGLNKLGLKYREEAVGQKCYRALQGKDAPCSFCTNACLSGDKFYEWEFYNPLAKGWYLLKDKLVKYEGRPVRLELAMDITRVTSQEQQIQKMLENEQIAMECACRLQNSWDERKALNDSLAMLGERLKGERCYIFELHGKTVDNTYEWCAPGIGSRKEQLHGIPIGICHFFMENLFKNEAFLIDDLEECGRKEPEQYRWLKKQQISSLILVPLFEQEMLSGFLGIDNPPIENEGNFVEILRLLAFFIQNTLTHIKSNDKLCKMTYADEMTGTKNRNAFIQAIEQINRKVRSGRHAEDKTGCGVVFVDVNGLKAVNDSAGHEEGDALLIRISRKVMQIFPDYEVFRTGGDEFVVLCIPVKEDVFTERIGRLKQSVAGQEELGSAAVGASWSDHAVYIEEIINQAEAEMYEAKKQYYIGTMEEERPRIVSSNSDTYTRLLMKNIDIVGAASELVHTMLEHWDAQRMALMLDDGFVLFEEENQKLYRKEEALRYLEKQQESSYGQTVRDVQFVRKRVISGVSICSCFGQLDWKSEDGRTCSVPMELSMVFVQKGGRVRCIYMHSTNIFYRSQYERNIYQVRNDILLNMISGTAQRGEIIEIPGNEDERIAAFRILADSFGLVFGKYSNIYFVDVQKDSYVALKTEGKFRSLVGVAGNYTGVNSDYAEQFMDTATRIRYLEFTGRRNLLDHLESGQDFLSMNFSVARDNDDANREVEISIWLGKLDDTVVSVFAFRNITKCPIPQIIETKDRLTGLFSYEKFREEGRKIFEKGAAGFAVISADIQNFKYVNEVLGYQEGDSILKSFAEKLPELLPGECFHTRVTGDLFLSLMRCGDDQEALLKTVKEIAQRFCTEQKKRNGDIKIVLRIGVYFAEDSCREIATAVDRANLARKSVGQSVDNEIGIYGEEIVRKSGRESEIRATMERALENGDIEIWLQPKICLADGTLCGAEALARWMQGSSVYFNPDDFIPVFESSGFVTSLDLYILEGVCRKLCERITAGKKDGCRISVNLSPVDIVRPGIVNTMLEIVDRYRLDHSSLEFELTETAYFKNSDDAIVVMERLKEEGFTTSVDDFGSGYSVMNMLINMPASVVKIDRIFMLDCIKTAKGYTFLERMIGIIHELGYRVLCEGIETEEQYRMLREMGCDEGQGYYFGKAMPMEEFFKRFLA